MTITTHAAAEALGRDWPGEYALILRTRVLRSAADAEAGSRFDDAIWRLQPAHPDAHQIVAAIHWQPDDTLPAIMVEPLKQFTFAMLNHPMPASLGVNDSDAMAAVTTVYRRSRDLRPFVSWMHQRGLRHFHDVTDADLDAYLDQVRQLGRSPAHMLRLLTSVRILWAYGPWLPPRYRLTTRGVIWNGRLPSHLADAVVRDRYNRTPRIAPDTMEALLAWALRIVEEIGPDIRDAWTAHQRIVDGVDQAHLRHLPPHQRVEQYLATADCLPGTITAHGVEIDWRFLTKVCMAADQWPKTLPAALRHLVTRSGLPIDPHAHTTPITATIDGKPWRAGPIPRTELVSMVRLLAAACFTVIAYLSGMRPGEVLNLRRGCRDIDADTGELLVRGHLGKGRFRRGPSDGVRSVDVGHDKTWTVVAPVHTAIAMCESLTGTDLLFPAVPAGEDARRPNHDHARTTDRTNADLDHLIACVNATYTGPGGTAAIPADPTRHIHASRLRRTLAYFIVRRPRGLIAAALQYGHVNTRVTLSYAGDPDPGWLNDIALERLEMVLDQTADDVGHLHDGEHISGPAADDYRQRVAAAARFTGRTVTSVANARRLLATADPNIHHGEAMTCVWNPDTALCRNAAIASGLEPSTEPDQARCRSNCRNLAYTDRDLIQLRQRRDSLAATAENPVTPMPLRQRAETLADAASEIITRHEQTRTVTHDLETTP